LKLGVQGTVCPAYLGYKQIGRDVLGSSLWASIITVRKWHVTTSRWIILPGRSDLKPKIRPRLEPQEERRRKLERTNGDNEDTVQ